MFLRLYLITLLVFLGIDSLWLGTMIPTFYRSQIGFIMADEPNLVAAGIFFGIFAFGLYYFVVEPCIREGKTLTQTAWRGAIFGFVTYATYDLTNHATLANWPLLMTIVDMAWGTVLGMVSAWISVWAGRRFVN